MKRKKIIHLLLIGVAMMMFAACASSRRVANESHQIEQDSIATISKDSVRKVVATSDSLVKVTTSEAHSSDTLSENGDFEETITEHITETVDSFGNKKTMTDRTIHRKGGYQKQSSHEGSQQNHQQEVRQSYQGVDSLAANTQSNVGTHWAARDSLSEKEEKNTDEVKKSSFMSKAKKNAFQLFLLMVVFLMLLSLKRKRDEKRSDSKSDDNQ